MLPPAGTHELRLAGATVSLVPLAYAISRYCGPGAARESTMGTLTGLAQPPDQELTVT